MDTKTPYCPIAIIGFSCRYPLANNPEEFWDNLIQGKDLVGPVPAARWYMNDKFQAGFLDLDLDGFDAKFFNVTPKEAVFMDPQQRLVLEVTWEAFENSGILPSSVKGTNMSIFIGIMYSNYRDFLRVDQKFNDENAYYCLSGTEFSALPSKLAHLFDVNGPCLAVETACASSGSAIHYGCQALQSGENSIAIAGGVNILLHAPDLPPEILSDRCRSYDTMANGLAAGEGCGILILKKLDDAIKNRDTIHGVIRATAMNQDGKRPSYGTPVASTQTEVIKEALRKSNISSDQISFIAGHGAGTLAGDPIEIEGILNAYYPGEETRDPQSPIYLQTIKSSNGHTFSASGVGSLIQVLLSFKYRTLPKQVNFKTLSPNINLRNCPLIIPTQNIQFPKSTKLIAGLNNFGISGTNVHMILEEPPEESKNSRPSTATQPYFLALSAKSSEAFAAQILQYKMFLEKSQDQNISDFVGTANLCRETFSHRRSFVFYNESECLKLMDSCISSKFGTSTHVSNHKIIFLFPGAGSEFIGMGQNLLYDSKCFQNYFKQCSKLYQKYFGIPLESVIWNQGQSQNNEKINQRLGQPALFLFEYCISKVWIEEFGIIPDVVIGHSYGEYAGAVCGSLLSLEEGLNLVVRRNELINRLPQGAMLAVQANKNIIQSILECNQHLTCDFASINSNQQIVLSGTPTTMKAFAQIFKDHDIETKFLSSDRAYHSSEMDPIIQEYEKFVSQAHFEATVPIGNYYSTMFGGKLNDPKIFQTSKYWTSHLRKPVLFQETLKNVIKDLPNPENAIFIEIGPGAILTNLVKKNYQEHGLKSPILCPTILNSVRNSWDTILRSISKIFTETSCFVNLQPLSPPVFKKTSLPTYPFQKKNYWYKNQNTSNLNIGPILKNSGTFLGSRIHFDPEMILYRNPIGIETADFIKDHNILTNILFPAAGLIEIILEAMKDSKQQCNLIVVNNASFLKPIKLQKDATPIIHTKCTKIETSNQQWKVEILKVDPLKSEEYFTKHATALAYTEEATLENIRQLSEFQMANYDNWTGNFMKITENRIAKGIKPFPGIQKVWLSNQETEMRAEILILYEWKPSYVINPVLLTLMFNLAEIFTSYKAREVLDLADEIKLPVHLKNLRIYTSNIMENVRRGEYIAIVENNGELVVSLYAKSTKCMVAELRELIFHPVKLTTISEQADKSSAQLISKEIWKPYNRITSESKRLNLNVTAKSSNFQELINSHPISRELMNKLKLCSVMRTDLNKLYIEFILEIFENLHYFPSIRSEISVQDFIHHIYSRNPELNHKLPFSEIYFLKLFYLLEDYGYLSRPEQKTKSLSKTNLATPMIVLKEMKITKSDFQEIHPQDTSNPRIKLYKTIQDEMSRILRGDITPLSLIFNDTKKENSITATEFYMEDQRIQLSSELMAKSLGLKIQQILSGEGTKNKVVRLLEIGAGTGSTTMSILEMLQEERIEFVYYFTDIGGPFLQEAKVKFKNVPNITYQKLDISVDPLTQGFLPFDFDFVIASAVLHATPNLNESCTNIRKVLRPGGWLVMMEILSKSIESDVCFGLLPGWFSAKDFRVETGQVLLERDEWEKLICSHGFGNSVSLFTETPNIAGMMFQMLNSDSEPGSIIVSPQYHWKILLTDHENLNGIWTKFESDLLSLGRKCQKIYITNQQEVSQLNLRKVDEDLEGILIFLTESETMPFVQTLEKCKILVQFLQLIPKIKEQSVVNRGIQLKLLFVQFSQTLYSSLFKSLITTFLNENIEPNGRILELETNDPNEVSLSIIRNFWDMGTRNRNDQREICVNVENGGDFFVPRLVRFSMDSSINSKAFCNPSSTYIIVGGFCEIGFQVIKWLIQKNAKYLVLVGHEVENQTEEEVKKECANGDNRNCQIKYISAEDISTSIGCQKLFKAIEALNFPEINGIFNLIGVHTNTNGPLFKNVGNWDKYLESLETKVKGTLNLYECSKDMNLDYFVSISSLASKLCVSGSFSYNAEIAFQNTFAKHKNVYSICWGEWKDQFMTQNEIFEPEKGLKAMELILSHQLNETVVIVGSPTPKILEEYPNLAKYFELFSFNSPNWKSESEFSVGHNLKELERELESLIQAQNYHTDLDNMKQIVRIVFSIISEIELREINEDDENGFEFYGTDSLMFLRFRIMLNEKLKLNISIPAFQQASINVNTLAKFIFQQKSIS